MTGKDQVESARHINMRRDKYRKHHRLRGEKKKVWEKIAQSTVEYTLSNLAWTYHLCKGWEGIK